MKRLVAAEVLKLRKRPVAYFAAALVVGSVVAIIALHLLLSTTGGRGFRGPAGGGEGYRSALEALFRFSFFGALLLGATSGAGDRASGVLKDLAASGVPRLRLFLVRIQAAVLVAETLALCAFVLALLAGLLLPGGGPMPGATAVLQDIALLIVASGTAATIALALSALLRSRTAAIVLFFAWETTIAPLIAHDETLGDGRWFLLGVALNRFARSELDLETLGIPLSVAAGVVALWLVTLASLAAWRESVREI